MATRIQLRRDTAANWTAANPVLAQGEEGHETDTGKRKVGDGVTAWAGLPYRDDRFTPASHTTATDPHTQYQARSEKGQAGGYTPLDSGLLIPRQYLPAVAITSRFVVASEADQIPLTAEEGDVAIRTDQSRSYIHNGGTAGTMADWDELLTPTDQVQSVDGRTGTVTLGDLYVNEADHNKAAHDALLIDAATLDGIDSTGFVPASHVDSTDGHPLATQTDPGFQSAADKAKTDRALDVEISQRVVYVSPTGSDATGDGTSANRWATIQHAVDQAQSFMEPRNGASSYKIVCATATYNETVIVPANQFAAFNVLGQGGIWITSETGVASDVTIAGADASRAVLCYGSASIEAVTLVHDNRGVEASGGRDTLVFVKDCVLRRASAADGGTAALSTTFATVVSRSNSTVTGQRFAYGLDAGYAGLVAKVLSQPTGSTANERATNGGAIR